MHKLTFELLKQNCSWRVSQVFTNFSYLWVDAVPNFPEYWGSECIIFPKFLRNRLHNVWSSYEFKLTKTALKVTVNNLNKL